MERFRTIALIALVGIGVWFLFFRSKNSGPPPEQYAVAVTPPVETRKPGYEEVQIHTNGLQATISSFSGAVKHLELTEPQFERIEKGKPMKLPMDISSTWEEESLPLRADLRLTRTDGNNLAPPYLSFRIVSHTDDGVELVADLPEAKAEIHRTYKAHGLYAFEVNTQVINKGDTALEMQLSQNLDHYVRRSDESGGFMRQSYMVAEGICQRSDGKTFRLTRDELTQRGKANESVTSQANFVSLGNLYFVHALIPQGTTPVGCTLSGEDRPNAQSPKGTLLYGRLVWPKEVVGAGASQDHSVIAYFGPKMTQAMKAAHPGLTDTINLGWFALIARGLLWLLVKLFSVFGNWGVAIILLTVIVRVSLYPLLARGVRSTAEMQRLKPELDAINAKHADDQEARGLATMELYRRHKINPLGGCLPSLAQLPVWWALYSTLQTSVELFHAPFLFWNDLSSSDPYFALPLILGVVMLVQQKLMPPSMPDPVQAKIMMYFMPAFMTVISLFLPAGLALYMLVNSLLAMLQQKITKAQVDRIVAANLATVETGARTTEAPATTSRESARPSRNNNGRSGGRRGGRR